MYTTFKNGKQTQSPMNLSSIAISEAVNMKSENVLDKIEVVNLENGKKLEITEFDILDSIQTSADDVEWINDKCAELE